MSSRLAGAVVFTASGGVLVLEVVALRLLAPYVGTDLRTYTTIIGTALAGIALGTWVGGRLADLGDPRRLLGPELVGGAALAALSVPLVRLLGAGIERPDVGSLLLLALVAVFAPATVLSAVSPTVVKLVLRDLDHTGRVVGRLSALGTVGAIVGTFLSGFVLEPLFPTPGIILGVAVVMAALGALLWGRGRRVLLAGLLAAAAGGAAAVALVPQPCQTETAYYCVRIEADPANPSGRFLRLDTLTHSYVDLADPTHLRFAYTRLFAAVIDAATAGPIDVLHIGGGGLTMPRWVSATRPGSSNLVLEVDPQLVEIVTAQLPLLSGPEVEVRVGDARIGIREVPEDSFDVVVGDAFGNLSVPWHLTTREFVSQVAAVLRPAGVYVLNVIDYRDLGFARAEAATLQRVFPYVAVASTPERLRRGGNIVLVGAFRPVDAAAVIEKAAADGLQVEVLTAAELDSWIGEAPVLTDDHAPVDQLVG